MSETLMQLVTVENGEPRTTTLAIADGMEVQHKNVLELVRNYTSDLEEFGRVAFETRPFETAGGTQKREIATLNEQQATLIMTYMKNTEIARAFKKRLVKAFYELVHTQPATPEMQIAHAMLLAGRLIEEQKMQIEQRDKLIADTAPKAAALDRLENADGHHNLTTAAKVLCMPPQKFPQTLERMGWLYRMGITGPWTGRQEKINAGYLVHKIYRQEMPDGTERARAQVLITPKGMARLAVILKDRDIKQAA